MADEPRTDDAPTDPPKAEPDKTFTQADVDRVVADRLERERKKYEGFDDLKAKAAELDQIKEANASEIEKAQNKATKAEERATNAEAKLLRFEVAAEKNVPPKLVPLLTATSKEELEGQADLILENAKPGDTPPPDFDGGTREPAPETRKPEDSHDDLALSILGIKPNQ
jgi:hypothetical protein